MIKVSMRLFQRENGIWYVEFGRGKKKSLRTRNKAEAVRLFNKLKREYLAGRLIILKQGQKILLSEFIPEYLDWCENNRSYETFKKARFTLNDFKDVIGNLYLTSLRKKHLDDYVSHLLARGLTKTSVNVYIRTLKSAFRDLIPIPIENHPNIASLM